MSFKVKCTPHAIRCNLSFPSLRSTNTETTLPTPISSAAHILTPPFRSIEAEASPQNPLPHYLFALQERTTTLLPSKRCKATVSTRNCFQKKHQRPYGHMVPYRNSFIGNHSTVHSENTGAVVHPPQLLKPLCFHSTVNKD